MKRATGGAVAEAAGVAGAAAPNRSPVAAAPLGVRNPEQHDGAVVEGGSRISNRANAFARANLCEQVSASPFLVGRGAAVEGSAGAAGGGPAAGSAGAIRTSGARAAAAAGELAAASKAAQATPPASAPATASPQGGSLLPAGPVQAAAAIADPCVAPAPPPPRGSNIARRTNCALSAISFFGSEPAAPPTLRKRRASEEGVQAAIRPATPPLGGLRVDITPKRLNLGRQVLEVCLLRPLS